MSAFPSQRLIGCLLAASSLVAACAQAKPPPQAYSSPIAAAAGDPYLARGALDLDQWPKNAATFNEWVAGCMRAKGFEFTAPLVRGELDTVGLEGEGRDTREYAARYGFGISTTLYFEEELDEGLVGLDLRSVRDSSAAQVGARGSRRDGESPAEIAAYEVALYQTNGCLQAAQEALIAPAVDFVTTRQVELEELEALTFGDSVIVERDRVLRECVRAAGHDFYSVADSRREFQRLADQIRPPGPPAQEPDEAERSSSLDAAQAAALREVQSFEQSLATAIFECDPEVLGTDTLFLSVYQKYEEEFVRNFLDPGG